LSPAEKARLLEQALVEKGGLDLRVLDLGEETAFTDFFVIATGTSDRHVQTLSEVAVAVARQAGEKPLGVEGTETGRWILVDLGDVVVHLFREEAREFYGLERLWGDDEPTGSQAAEAAP
jgi:ribosome-associated protein